MKIGGTGGYISAMLCKNFELELFSGELCHMGEEVGISTPYSKKAYEKLKNMQSK